MPVKDAVGIIRRGGCLRTVKELWVKQRPALHVGLGIQHGLQGGDVGQRVGVRGGRVDRGLAGDGLPRPGGGAALDFRPGIGGLLCRLGPGGHGGVGLGGEVVALGLVDAIGPILDLGSDGVHELLADVFGDERGGVEARRGLEAQAAVDAVGHGVALREGEEEGHAVAAHVHGGGPCGGEGAGGGVVFAGGGVPLGGLHAGRLPIEFGGGIAEPGEGLAILPRRGGEGEGFAMEGLRLVGLGAGELGRPAEGERLAMGDACGKDAAAQDKEKRTETHGTQSKR